MDTGLPAGTVGETRAIPQIPELDGLRGLAIVLVLFFHLTGDSPKDFGYLSAVYWAFAYGWAGVDLFFVLSGFLITGILLATKDSPEYFSTFYARRVLRIFPLYFLAVALFFYVELPLRAGHLPIFYVMRAEQIWYWTYLVNWRDASGHMIGALGHFWSLSIEEQFYLAWPLAIWLAPRRRIPMLCIGVIVISFTLRLVFDLTGASVEFIHRATFTRLDTLVLGGLLAVAAKDPGWTKALRKRITFIASAALVLYTISEWVARQHGRFPGWLTLNYTFPAVIFGCLVFHCAAGSGGGTLACRIARSPTLRSLGKYSYSMYLFHLIAKRYGMVPVVVQLWHWGLPLPVAFVLGMLLCGAAVYAFALLTWHGFEKHFLKLKSRFSYTHIQGSHPTTPSPAELA